MTSSQKTRQPLDNTEFSTGWGKLRGKLDYARIYAWKKVEKTRKTSVYQAKLWISVLKLWISLCKKRGVENFFGFSRTWKTENFTGRNSRHFTQFDGRN